MSRTSLKLPALAATAALALAGAPAHAITVTEQFDGSWLNPAQGGRGLLVDVIPGANGQVTFFAAGFSYDGAGNPFWFTIQPILNEGQSTASNVEVRRFSGGSFGDAFTPPNPGGGVVMGTATLSVNTCNSITLNIATNGQANGLPNVNYQLQRLGAVPAGCPYTVAFTACPTGTTAVAGQTATCALTGTYTQNLTLANNATYLLNGKVQIGTPLTGGATQTANLTIQPGTLIKGGGGTSDYLVVNPGSKIFAEGNVNAPIVFTGPTETGGSWAGVFLAGRAPVNAAAAPGGTVAFEADANIIFGGNNANDSSGVMRYVQIRNAGQTIAPNRELNSLTMGGVGAGTVLEYIQAHNGTDDAFEWFGGTVNARYLVATGNDDDNLDMDFGYTGKVQYAYVTTDAQIDGSDGRCIESDNNPNNFDLTPRTQPKIANLTCRGAAAAPQGLEAMRLRRGSAGNYFNSVFTGYPTGIFFNDAATFTATGQPNALTGATTLQGGFVGATTNFNQQAGAAFTVEAWFNAQTGNVAGNAATALTGRFATPAGPLDGTAVGIPNDAFFENVSYKGAFGPAGIARDWTAGWTYPGSVQ